MKMRNKKYAYFGGVVLLLVLLFSLYVQKGGTAKVAPPITSETSYITKEQEVIAYFEGETKLGYKFSYPDYYSLKQENQHGTRPILTYKGKDIIKMHISYEGGRGYTVEDYIVEVLAKDNPILFTSGTTTIAGVDWKEVESETKSWRLASIDNKTWIFAIETSQDQKVLRDKILDSMEFFRK